RNILPLIRQEYPEIRFSIVGKNPPYAIQNLAEGRIVVTGIVPDVRPYFARARVVVVPLLVGGGTRLKILESMAMGRPIVSTTLGAEGISARHGEHLMLADEPAVFAKNVVELINNPEKSQAMGQTARKFVKQHFDWTSITNSLCRDLSSLKREA
ncbi:MAG: glycosyltransferase, partial [Proteobacteria bacterium]|nr:glycosyltransferase [Pseudomonadota bacterium]